MQKNKPFQYVHVPLGDLRHITRASKHQKFFDDLAALRDGQAMLVDLDEEGMTLGSFRQVVQQQNRRLRRAGENIRYRTEVVQDGVAVYREVKEPKKKK